MVVILAPLVVVKMTTSYKASIENFLKISFAAKWHFGFNEYNNELRKDDIYSPTW